jgi:hypothetical protein
MFGKNGDLLKQDAGYSIFDKISPEHVSWHIRNFLAL